MQKNGWRVLSCQRSRESVRIIARQFSTKERLMKVAKSLMNFAWFVLIGFGVGVLSPESRGAEALESSALRIELNTSPYSYRVIEKSSGEVLVSENCGIV